MVKSCILLFVMMVLNSEIDRMDKFLDKSATEC